MKLRAFAVVGALAVSAFTCVTPPLAAQQDCAPPAVNVSQAGGWALQRLAPEDVWGFSRGDSALVAVVGTGVSSASPALTGAVQGGDGNDCSGRDTFISGLIAARPMPGTGFTGIAPGAKILPIKVSDDDKKIDPARLATGIRQAADSGARVIAVTVGTPSAAPDLRESVRYALSRNSLVIAAADTSIDSKVVSYPAGFPEALAVSGVSQAGSPVQSSTTARPSLVAPGGDVISIGPSGPGHLTASEGGIAVGFVAGTAALVRDYHRNLSATQVRNRLEQTADHPSTRLPDPQRGYGVVNPNAAVTTLLPAESGEQPLPANALPVKLPPVPVKDPLPTTIALAITILVGTATLIGAITTVVARRARDRSWKSAWTD